MSELANSESHGNEPQPLVGHVVPLWLLAAVFGILIVMTALTVAATYIDLGKFNIWLAILIAGFKASLVGLYFMHLRWDRPIHGFLVLAAIGFVVLFIGLPLMDSLTYQPTITEAVQSLGG